MRRSKKKFHFSAGTAIGHGISVEALRCDHFADSSGSGKGYSDVVWRNYNNGYGYHDTSGSGYGCGAGAGQGEWLEFGDGAGFGNGYGNANGTGAGFQ